MVDPERDDIRPTDGLGRLDPIDQPVFRDHGMPFDDRAAREQRAPARFVLGVLYVRDQPAAGGRPKLTAVSDVCGKAWNVGTPPSAAGTKTPSTKMPWTCGLQRRSELTRWTTVMAPPRPTVEFEQGLPTKLNGKKLPSTFDLSRTNACCPRFTTRTPPISTS